MMANTEQILAEIARLKQSIPVDQQGDVNAPTRSNPFMLDRYLDDLASYTETVCGDVLQEDIPEFSDEDD